MNKSKQLEHFLQLTPQEQLGAISSNLRHISNWAYYEPNEARLKNIKQFLDQTELFTKNMKSEKLPPAARKRFDDFKKELPLLQEQLLTAMDNNFRRLVWGEKMLTWSNLLGS